MADTVRPCRCSSRIIMSCASVTTVLLPPAKGSSIGGDGVGPPRGKCPRRPAATTKLGKIRGPQMGRIHRPLTVTAPDDMGLRPISPHALRHMLDDRPH